MKIAVLGLGFMGSTHVNAWRQISGAELAAVASLDPRRLSGDFTGIQGNLGGQTGKLDFSSVAKYASAEEAVLDPAVEAVDICLPTPLHERIAVLALDAGKHVLVEKPMALDGASADRMVAAAGHGARSHFSPAVRRARLERLAHRPRAKRRRSAGPADPRHRFLPACVRRPGSRNGLRIRRFAARRGLDPGAILVSIDWRGGDIRR